MSRSVGASMCVGCKCAKGSGSGSGVVQLLVFSSSETPFWQFAKQSLQAVANAPFFVKMTVDSTN